jgi:cytochrome c556
MQSKIPGRFALVFAALLLAGGFPQAVLAQGMKTPLQEKRSKAMKSMGGASKAIRKAASAQAALEPAQRIQAVAGQFAGLFPAGSGGPATRAKPEVWQNPADFKAKTAGLKTFADGLVKAAASGDLGAVKAAAGGFRKACGSCHKTYRVPKKKK